MSDQFNVNVKVLRGANIVTFESLENESILDTLIKQGYYISALCGGKSSCGKCRVQVIEGNLKITTQDRTMFTDSELTMGSRLACKAYPTEDCTIRIIAGNESEFEVINDFNIEKPVDMKSEIDNSEIKKIKAKETKDKETKAKELVTKEIVTKEIETKEIETKELVTNEIETKQLETKEIKTKVIKAKKIEAIKIETLDNQEDSYGIGIDLGTTTIVVNLVGLTSKNIIQSYSTINKQRAYGADVISRIQAANEGKHDLLRDSIKKDLLEGIRAVIEGVMLQKESVSKIVIAGNTTMGHILMGYSCRTLGVFPYTPVTISTIEVPFLEIFASNYLDIPVTILPGISTYVGGDIVAGLLACNFDKTDASCMLIDLGTNGEIAIGNRDRILVSSTAAGPAFEGGNISCGVGSIAGAISHITIEGNHTHYQTIGDKEPVGICGTGVIEITSELLKEGLVDETGLLIDEYFEDGYKITEDENGNRIIFTQKDIREIQLAKSAIRAGIEILIRQYGLAYDKIDTVYLAGGFGYKIDILKAIHIGLLPKELHKKIKAIGNSSLAGAIEYLINQEAKEKIATICHVAKEINLSNEIDFNELYIEYISF